MTFLRTPMNMPMDERYVKLLQSNPNYLLGQNALAQGASTAPVQGMGDGMARVLQGVMGGIATKNASNKLAAAEASRAANNSTLADKLREVMAKGAATPPIAPAAPVAPGQPPVNPMQGQPQGMGTPQLTRTTPMPGSAQATKNGVNYDQFKRAIIAQESGGRYGVLNTEGSGAMGVGQVMPDTARALARKLGMPYREDLMKGTSQEAQAYQNAITDAAIQDAWSYGGNGADPIKSAKYYFAGPDLKGWGPKTRKYGSDIARRLGTDGGPVPADAQIPPGNGPQGAAPQWQAPEAPPMPEMPSRPAPRENAKSGLLEFGLQMLETKDPAMMQEGMQLVTKGLEERFMAEREGIAREYGLDTGQYEKALGNYYGAQDDARGSTYRQIENVGADNRRAQQATWERGNAVEDRNFNANEENKAREDEQSHAFALAREQSKLAIDRALQVQRARGTGGQVDWTAGPAAKTYNDSTNAAAKAAQMNADLNRFLQLNDMQETGTWADRTPGFRSVRKWGSDALQTMDTINNTWGPLMREAGSGAMSDKDMAVYMESIPSTSKSREANRNNAMALIRANNRISDFHTAKISALDAGQGAAFSRDWSRYIAEVSPYAGDSYISYDQWKSIPQFDRTGRRVR